MMGYLQILEARERRESATGFDLKSFNRNVLSCLGPMDDEFESCLQLRENQ